MHLRADALTGAAEMMLALEVICREPHAEGPVGTVGKCHVEPNASNVIPGAVTFEMEVRSLSTDVLEGVRARFQERAARIAEERGLAVAFDSLSKSEAIHVTEEVQAVIEAACRETGRTMRLPSGAGHDGNQLARIAPIGMIFVPSRDGRSHCPEEWTDYEAVELGVQALMRSVLAFDQSL